MIFNPYNLNIATGQEVTRFLLAPEDSGRIFAKSRIFPIIPIIRKLKRDNKERLTHCRPLFAFANSKFTLSYLKRKTEVENGLRKWTEKEQKLDVTLNFALTSLIRLDPISITRLMHTKCIL